MVLMPHEDTSKPDKCLPRIKGFETYNDYCNFFMRTINNKKIPSRSRLRFSTSSCKGKEPNTYGSTYLIKSTYS